MSMRSSLSFFVRAAEIVLLKKHSIPGKALFRPRKIQTKFSTDRLLLNFLSTLINEQLQAFFPLMLGLGYRLKRFYPLWSESLHKFMVFYWDWKSLIAEELFYWERNESQRFRMGHSYLLRKERSDSFRDEHG